MLVAEILASPVLSRALVLGAFGGVGLVLTAAYSRRGPLIFPVYAALLAALAILLSRYSGVAFGVRFCAAAAGIALATAALYVAARVLGGRERARLRASGHLPAAGSTRVGAGVRLLRAGMVLGAGALASAGVAFVAA